MSLLCAVSSQRKKHSRDTRAKDTAKWRNGLLPGFTSPLHQLKWTLFPSAGSQDNSAHPNSTGKKEGEKKKVFTKGFWVLSLKHQGIFGKLILLYFKGAFNLRHPPFWVSSCRKGQASLPSVSLSCWDRQVVLGNQCQGLLGNITSVESVDLHCSTPYPSAVIPNGKASRNYSAACKVQWVEHATSALIPFITEGGKVSKERTEWNSECCVTLVNFWESNYLRRGALSKSLYAGVKNC